mgnify:CR=1 FL=1
MYAQDYEEHFPPMEDSVQLEKLLRPYSKDVPWKFPPYNNVRYASNPSLSRKLQEKLENPAEVVMLYEPVVRRGFRLVAYADGHVKMIREEHWAELRQKSGIPLRTEPTIAPWWRWDTKGPREPLNQEVILLTFVYLGWWLVLVAAFLRLRYAPLTFLQSVGEMCVATIGYLVITGIIGSILGLVFFSRGVGIRF